MIVAAAIRLDGNVYIGRRHSEIISAMVENYHLPTPIRGEQGFKDDEGHFLNRHEAGEHAIACGQIEKLHWPGMGLDSSEVFPRGGKEEP